ncbi:conserved hypothetical protein [Pseudomonas sp. 8Z]|uniref:extensin-like domain-containing protein n=1 Tax=Pseudomonas sp. 8Z TaxID=2653166 RepID=UPI0012EFED69|nr:extensin family protein [Pseudomonas sp. 8Z]VXC76004.1 conserved hypothetical protein [Pseudomonas sp. 8Z]
MLTRIVVRGQLLTLLFGAVVLLAIWRGWLEVAPRFNPWAPLDVREAPNLLTDFKLWRLRDDRNLCDQALATSGMQFTRLADSTPQPGCPIENALRIQSAGVSLSSSFMATCPLAVSFALFERHGLQPAALAVFGQPVVRLEHVGSFACRNIAGSQRPSQHAYANALDIVGLRLRDGRLISVLHDWSGDNDEARFLRQVQAAACEHFNLTLGPDYNAAHRDHFHVDMGLWRMCR